MRQLTAASRVLAIQIFKFGIIGVLGFVVDVVFFHIGLSLLDLGKFWSPLFSFPFAVTSTWLGNRYYTFRGRYKGSAGAQWMRFVLACSIGLVINRGAYYVLIYSIPLIYNQPTLGLVGGTVAAMFFNFVVSRKLVFL